MKVKIEISICTGLMLNDHSNPYRESTTVLSDNYYLCVRVIIIGHSIYICRWGVFRLLLVRWRIPLL